jgi:hypothetical protein
MERDRAGERSADGEELRSMGDAGAGLIADSFSLNVTLLDCIAKNRKRKYGVKSPGHVFTGTDIAND